ncbi:MAG: hypothetical protein Q7K43_01860, partial [Candidatus Woesearchaeota archaeon]|nr:hypothetical protein [Candidatus Woesearchaeota archaeon]
SLPKKWTAKYKVKQGHELDVNEHGRQLILHTDQDFASNAYQLDMTTFHPLINFGLTALYIRGIDELEVTSQKPEHIAKLQEKPINQFIGFEIVEQSKNRALIKDVSGIKDLDLNTLLRRIFLLLLSESSESITSLKKKELDWDHVLSIDLNVNRFSFLSQRLLLKRGAPDPHHTPILYYLVAQLEAIGDEFKHLSEYIMSSKSSIDKDSIVFFERAHDLLEKFSLIFFKFDRDNATHLDTAYRHFAKDFEKYLGIAKPANIRTLVFAGSIADRVADCLRQYLVVVL